VVEGMTVCARHVEAPRAARPAITGAPAWSSASGRNPSMEKMTTRGGVGAATGATGSGGVGWAAECPQPEARATSATSGASRAQDSALDAK